MRLINKLVKLMPKKEVSPAELTRVKEPEDAGKVHKEKIDEEGRDENGEYEILEREILPEKIICPDCGGITLEGLDFCDKCGGELK